MADPLLKTKLEEISQKLDEILERITITVPITKVEIIPVLVNRYEIIEVDLTVERAVPTPIGLKRLILDPYAIPYVSYLTILSVPAPFKLRLNDKDAKPINAQVGIEWEDWKIEEIYIENAAAPAGTEKAELYMEFTVE